MIVASQFGQIVHPIFVAFAWALSGFYDLVPNFAIAIALLTIAVMILVFPITRKATRSMMKMQLLAPELKKLQAKYKVQPGSPVAERQEARQKLNQEMMALYKENGASPTGGCLPMFMQFPIFLVLYDTIRGLTHESKGKLDPLYISHSSKLFEAIQHSHGALSAFGINLSDSVRSAGLSGVQKIPFIALILVAIVLQYIQMKQLNGRNPAAAAANPQMQQMQKIFPIVFAVIYISIPAGVNIYFIVSSLFRIGQQEFMYRRDPDLQASLARLQERSKSDPKVIEARLKLERNRTPPRSLRQRLLAPTPVVVEKEVPPASNGASPKKSSPPRKSASSRPGAGSSSKQQRSNQQAQPMKKSQPRAQNKRPRKAR